MENITLRRATIEDLGWVNDRYKDVNFVSSDINREFIAIAEVNGTKAGLGRLVTIDNSNCELGGMYVLPEYRKLGLATSIVEFLLRSPFENKNVFCLPFSHLSSFYQKFGFRKCNTTDVVPNEINEKHIWCNKTYQDETLLFVLDSV